MLARFPALDLRRPTAAACLDYLRAEHPVPARTLAEAGVTQLPAAVEDSVLRCLSRDPARRPADGAAMAALFAELAVQGRAARRGSSVAASTAGGRVAGGGRWRAALQKLFGGGGGGRSGKGRFSRPK